MRRRGRSFVGSVVVLAVAGCPGPASPSAPGDSAAPEGPVKLDFAAAPLEDLRDPALTGWRVQFVYQVDGEPRAGIFSVGVDGRELRRVVAAERLGDATLEAPPSRSPDGRYLVVFEHPTLTLLDLRTSEAPTLLSEWSSPDVAWVGSGRLVHHHDEYAKTRLKERDLERGTSELIDMPETGYFHPLPDGRMIRLTETRTFEVVDRAGAIVSSATLPVVEELQGYLLSPDGALVLYGDGATLYVVARDAPDEPLYTEEARFSLDAAFRTDGEALYVSRDEELIEIDLATGARRVVCIAAWGGLRHLQAYRIAP